MGLITSRLPLDGLRPGRRRSQQEETLYSYSLNKNYFSNYFFMGGERFEVNDPDYLFGDNCDLNFLTCTKPYSLPYKKAQLNLLLHLNNKQKAMNKVSSRVNSLSTPLNILTGRNRQVAQSRKQDAQIQTLNKGLAKGPEPSQPLVMLINIRKETLRLVKSSNVHNIDSDQNSLMTNTASVSQATPERRTRLDEATGPNTTAATKRLAQKSTDLNRHSLASGSNHNNVDEVDNVELNHATYYSRRGYRNSDSSSITSNTLSSAQSTVTSKSGGYTSVKDVPPSDCASDENDECYQDALNEPTEDDSDSMRDQARENSTKGNLDIKITINNSDDRTDDAPQYHPGFCDMSETTTDDEIRQLQAKTLANTQAATTTSGYPRSKAVVQATAASTKLTNARTLEQMTTELKGPQASNRVYNIEFTFDAEVDCSIRIFYFCTREVTSNSVTYKPQHATYKSKTYTYKRGLNQKFEQREHTFQPYLFDEDLLIYKPLDMDGNYNSGAVFPIVIYLAALEGPAPRQSQSLVATVEKSQLDDSYSIKALKQLIFVDGVQYILQDIYGIENRPLASANASSSRAPRLSRNLRASCASLYSTSNFAGSSLNLSDTASIASFVDGNLNDTQDGDGGATNQYKSLGSENTFECVICMSDERDTMLLPCRHLCLCSSCAQSLRYQASSCPICRCPFKAALNLRVIQRRASQQHRSGSASASNEALATNDNTSSVRHHPLGAAKLDNNGEQYHASTARITRRESITSPATPLLPNASSVPDDLGGPASEVAATVSGSAARSKKLMAAKFLPHQSSSARDTAVASQAGVIASPLASRSKSSSTTANVRDSTSNEDFSAMSVTLEMQTMSDGSGRAEERVARS